MHSIICGTKDMLHAHIGGSVRFGEMSGAGTSLDPPLTSRHKVKRYYLRKDSKTLRPNAITPLVIISWTALAKGPERDNRVGEDVRLQLAELDLGHLHI